jgi:hypothetical protein
MLLVKEAKIQERKSPQNIVMHENELVQNKKFNKQITLARAYQRIDDGQFSQKDFPKGNDG